MTPFRSAIQQEPARGFYFDMSQFAALDGLDLMRAFVDGRALPPAISYLYGNQMTSVEPDSVTFTMPASGWLLCPQGVISGATLALLADGPLGCTISTRLPPATPYTTAEMSLTYIRPAQVANGVLTGTGRLIHVGRTLALSEVAITGPGGELLAMAYTRCVVQPRVDFPADMVEAGRAGGSPPVEPEWPTPHPWQRPVQGEVLPPETWRDRSGLDVLAAQARGELPAPPISHLLGVTPTEVAEGRTTWVMPATEWMCSPVPGRLYGGVTAYLAGTAIDGAFLTTAPAGTAFAPVDLKVYFLRPVEPDGRDLTATSQVVHRGRTMVIGTSEVRNADGKPVATATASAVYLPGRSWASVRGELDEAGAAAEA